MAYYGEELHACLAQAFNFSLAHVIVVSGDKWNPCGHALLNTGDRQGFYFHVAPPIVSHPKYMNETGYQRYLKEHKKHELKRQRVTIPKPQLAQARLDELLSKKWTWGVLPNNCADFVENVLAAGGSSVGVYSNCPALERWS